jgi:hypothetical protein
MSVREAFNMDLAYGGGPRVHPEWRRRRPRLYPRHRDTDVGSRADAGVDSGDAGLIAPHELWHRLLGGLWHRLLGRPASESGRLCHGDGGHEGGDRYRRVANVGYPP